MREERERERQKSNKITYFPASLLCNGRRDSKALCTLTTMVAVVAIVLNNYPGRSAELHQTTHAGNGVSVDWFQS